MADDEKSSDKASEPLEAANTAETAEALPTLDADAVIEAFGGIRPMAAKLEVAVSTVQGWKIRCHIPENHWRDIIASADANGIDLSAAAASDAEAILETDSGDLESGNASDPSARVDDVAEMVPEGDRDGSEPEAAPADIVPETDDGNARSQPKAAQGGGLSLLVALVALVLVVARPAWAPHVDPILSEFLPMPKSGSGSGAGPRGTQVEALQVTVDDLSVRIGAVEDRPVTSGDGTAALPSDASDRLSALEERIATLDDDLASVREAGVELLTIRNAADSAMTETQSALQAFTEREEATRARLLKRLGVLENLLSQVAKEAEEAASGLAGLQSVVTQHGDAITTLERKPAIEGAAQTGLALAIGDIESALADGRPFAGPLARIAELGAGNPGITDGAAAMQSYAAAGVPTRAALLAAFRRDAPDMQTEPIPQEGDWIETLIGGAESLVSIRRKGETPDMPAVSRAEAALKRGDLISAVAALSGERERSSAIATWLDGAETRIAAEAHLAALRSAIAATLTGRTDGDTS